MTAAVPVTNPEQGLPVLDTLAVDSLIRLRWLAVLGQFVTILTARFTLEVHIQWLPVLLIIGTTALTNLFLILLRRAGTWLSISAVPHVMAWDTLLLAALLYWTGGTENPFTLFLLLNAVLAALTLSRLSAWLLMLVGLISLLVLIQHHHPLLHLNGKPLSADHLLVGRIVAFFLISSTLIHLVQRLRGQLRREMRTRRQTQEHLAEERRHHSIATLAAGAAHELGTPLSTIAVVSREMELELQNDEADHDLTQMARTINSQVERCQQILSRLRPELTPIPTQNFHLTELQTQLLEHLNPEDQTRCFFHWHHPHPIHLPLQAIREALGNLIRNALQSSTHHQPVDINAQLDAHHIHFTVRDHGHGIPAAIRRHLGEPFLTTKPPGQGMGLGLHLVKLLAHQLGGSLHFTPAPGGGETFTLTLPNHATKHHTTAS
ncbi:HAMP domain-containing histidine kinase [Phragmitibacter flavus]|uniref:histidine kinase n=1 Tax=Phragmitibacter flavus TaxID=2576071 RepID=A0A5R8KA44_9BACT|nr:ATP-binding protein [Phragmitibacter flavus]TLD69178.1 HAMP domain-containing histidine kinase [Phragmitibacter flavus]